MGEDDDYYDGGSGVVEMIDNGDGTFTDPNDGSIFQDGQQIGWDNGDGTWIGLDGQLYNDDGSLVESQVEPDPATAFRWDDTYGAYYDPLTDKYYRIDDNGEVYVADIITHFPESGDQPAAQEAPGFFESVGNFFAKLFGGSGTGGTGAGGGGFGGGGSGGGSGSQQQAQQRANQAAQQLHQAQAQGASAAQLNALRAQLAIAQAAVAQTGGSDLGKYFLIAAGALTVAYVATSSRRK